MSRNFELLQRLGMEQDLFVQQQSAAGTFPAEEMPIAVVEDHVGPFGQAGYAPTADMGPPPELDLEGGEREEISRLVNKIFLIPSTSPARVVAMAGAESGDGCTWVTGYVAKFLAAQVTSPVCEVDANLQSPGLHEAFGVERGIGLGEALVAIDPIRRYAKPVWQNNLFLVTAGQQAENWQGLLASERMRSRLVELRSEFEYVILDVPALSDRNQGVILGPQVDGVVMVVRANSTRREMARKAVDDLTEAHVRILGAVLNQHAVVTAGALFSRQ